AEPAGSVMAALLTTDAAVESGRFRGTLNERGFIKKRRVISANTVNAAFNLRRPSDMRIDQSLTIGYGDISLRTVAIKKKIYARSAGANYFWPVANAEWRRMFSHRRNRPLAEIAAAALAVLGDWREEAPAVSDGVPVRVYSASTDFAALGNGLLQRFDQILMDGFFSLVLSDPERWKDAEPAGPERPRVSFGVDDANVLRTLAIDAPSRLTTQGYEITGGFELIDVNENVTIRRLARARRLTAKNAAKFWAGLGI
ncbi:MAG: hypothetical protein WAP37_09635, partial [Solirubrobacterales bacterium]